MLSRDYAFQWGTLRSVVAGASAVDLEGLAFEDREQALGFMRAYGYDPRDPGGAAEIAAHREKALRFLREELLADEPSLGIPPDVAELPVEDLLLLVSDPAAGERAAWACSILRVMHAFVHSRNDPYDRHQELIRRQILERIERHLVRGQGGLSLGDGADAVPLVDFSAKRAKSTSRIVMKLLHKPGNLGESIYDYVGVRFIVKDLLDVMRVLRYLRLNNVAVFANVAPERSRNTLLDIDAFQAVVSELQAKGDYVAEDELRRLVNQTRLRAPGGTNVKSSFDYRAIHFTVRQLIEVPLAGGESMRFFFPYEVQILDQEAAEDLRQGDAAHAAYVARQRQDVKRRVLRALLFRRGMAAPSPGVRVQP